MTTQHTSGPWVATERHGYREILGPRECADWFGTKETWAVAYCDTDRDEAEQDANARLIAAAPALLEALESVLQAKRDIETHVKGGQMSAMLTDPKELRARADAAFAKADAAINSARGSVG